MKRTGLILIFLGPLFAIAQFQFEKTPADLELNGPIRSVLRLEISVENSDTTTYRTAFSKSGQILLDLEAWDDTEEETEFLWNDDGQCTALQASTGEGFLIYTFAYSAEGKVQKMDYYSKSQGSDTSVTREGSALFVYEGNMKMELSYGPTGKLQAFIKSYSDQNGLDTAKYYYGADSTLNRTQRLYYDKKGRVVKGTISNAAGIVGNIEYTYGPNNSTIIQRMDGERKVYQQSQENLNEKGLREYYSLEDDLMKFSSEYSCEYTYDEQGNWIKRTTQKDKKPFLIETRSITYYK